MVYLVVVAVGYSSVAEINKRRPEPEFLISIIPIATIPMPYFARKLFRLLSAPLIELLWITIHGVIQLVVSATKK